MTFKEQQSRRGKLKKITYTYNTYLTKNLLKLLN